MIREKNARAFKMGIDNVTEGGDPAHRLDPGKQSYWTLTNRELDAIVEKVEAARKVVGPNVELALECHARYNTESAIQIGRAVAPARPLWLEEPVTSDNVEALALVHRSIPIPLAAGENMYTRYGFREAIEKQAVSVLQPDMCKCGGLLESRKIANMAEIYHIPIAPHGTSSPLGQMAYAHVCATIPNFLILEWGFLFAGTELNALMRNLPDYDDGFVQLPDSPGIGIELNDDAVREKLKPGSTWS
jgi:galactonate dehydratase